MSDPTKNSGPCDGPELTNKVTEQTPVTAQTDTPKQPPSQAPIQLDFTKVFVSMVDNAMDTYPRTESVEDVLMAIQQGIWKEEVEEVRQARATGGKEAAAPLKKMLPGVLFSGVFTARKNAGLTQYSQILCVDLDELGQRLPDLRAKLDVDPHVIAVFLSPSGEGLKVLLFVGGDAAQHRDAFLAAEAYFKRTYDVEIDKACKDVARLCFVSYDPDLKVKPEVIPLPLLEPVKDVVAEETAPKAAKSEQAKSTKKPRPVPKQSAEPVPEHEHPLHRVPFLAAVLWDAMQDIPADDYDTWLRVGMGLHTFDVERGFELWETWSRTSSKFADGVCEAKWASFDSDHETKVGFPSILMLARNNGWGADAIIVNNLATLPVLDFDRHVGRCAEYLGVKPMALTQAVETRRAEMESAKTLGQFSDVEPTTEPVSGSALLNSLASCFTRHVILPQHAAEAVALWLVHTYCFKAFTTTPRLHAHSPTKRCGKTVLLSLLSQLANRALFSTDLSAAVLFRVIERVQPTVIMDEWDSSAHGDRAEGLRNVLNSGFQRNGVTWRAVRVEGRDFEARPFSTFAPVAVAGIHGLPDTIADRSITIRMRRRLPTESVESTRGFNGTDLKRQCQRWAQDNYEALAAARPEVPAQLNDRQADCWETLLAIADVAGGEWPRKAREAAVALSATAHDDDGYGTALLADIRKFFDGHEGDEAFCSEVYQFLVGLAESPWGTYFKGQPITRHKLGRMLSAFGVTSKTVRDGDRADKGWHRDQFIEVWHRYLPPDGGEGAAPVVANG